MYHLIGIYGLIFKCPFHYQLDTCLFLNIRKCSNKDRFNLLEKRTIIEVNQLLEKHIKCSKKHGNIKIGTFFWLSPSVIHKPLAGHTASQAEGCSVVRA